MALFDLFLNFRKNESVKIANETEKNLKMDRPTDRLVHRLTVAVKCQMADFQWHQLQRSRLQKLRTLCRVPVFSTCFLVHPSTRI